MDEARALLSDIDLFLSSRKMAESTFGRKAVNDGKLVTRLKNGTAISIVTAEKIRQFIATNGAPAHALETEARSA